MYAPNEGFKRECIENFKLAIRENDREWFIANDKNNPLSYYNLQKYILPALPVDGVLAYEKRHEILDVLMHHISKEEIETIKRMRRNLCSVPDIALTLGKKEDAIRWILKKLKTKENP